MNHQKFSRSRPFIFYCLLFASSLLVITAAQAKTSNWHLARLVRAPLAGQVLYGPLSSPGASAWYRFGVNRPTTINVILSVPTWTSEKFQPHLVFYQPESMTIGPVLPMDQPPQTAASVYPPTESTVRFNSLTLVQERVRLRATLTTHQAGWYYLAVYNPGVTAGRYRLEFAGSRWRWPSILTWPLVWWQDQAWAGWTLVTMFLPLWLVALVAWSWLVMAPVREKKIIKNKKR